MHGPQPSDPSESRRAALMRWPLIALLIAMAAIGPMTLNILVPAIPSLATRLATDAATVQLTVSLFLFGMAVSQLLLGPLSDRYGRRPVVLAGFSITALASLAALAVDDIFGLVAARLVQALGASTGVVMGRAIIRDLFEREQAASMIGAVTTAMVVAPMIAPMIGGALDTAFGFEAIFAFVAASIVLVLVWAALALPETRVRPASVSGHGQFTTDVAMLGRSAPFIGYVCAASFGSASFFAFLGGGPFVVITSMGRSSAEYGLWFALAAFGFMAGNFVTSRLTGRVGLDRMIGFGIASQVVGAVVAVPLGEPHIAGGMAAIFLPQVLVSFGNGVLLPNAIAGAVSIRPHAAGAAAGITGFVQMTSGAIAAQFTGWVVAGAQGALPMTLTILAIVILTAATFFPLVRVR